MGMTSGGSSRSKAVLSEINVTPLVDVMLVLLIMFMVTTPLMQQGIEVKHANMRRVAEDIDNKEGGRVSREARVEC